VSGCIWISDDDEASQTPVAAKYSESNSNSIKDRLAEAGSAMLETMKQTDGAVTLESGVVLHVLEDGPEGKGQGVRPTRASTVKIHYHGTLADGTMFDTTLGGDPVTFPLAGVIPGWRDGVLKMHEGETAMLGIPPDQAYGSKGMFDHSTRLF
jgi:FKBP-type peptidyl-prolyl cis-trans isomerase FkpA